jgi:hypothetical protein
LDALAALLMREFQGYRCELAGITFRNIIA